MLVILSGIVVGVALGLLSGGRPRQLAHLDLRFGWVFVLALLVEDYTAIRLVSDPQVPLALSGALLLGSYLAVLATIGRNHRLPGLWLVGFGVLLNLLATTPHGGLMPATPEALRAAGRPVPVELPSNDMRPYTLSKDIVLPREQIPLWAISDRFVVPSDWPLAGVFSPGDVAVAAGVAWLLARGLVGHRRLALAV